MADFSDQFRKYIFVTNIGYNINILRQSACLVFNPITVNNFASPLKCTPVGRASDSMMESKKISNDQELIQSDPISCPQNQKGNNQIHKLTIKSYLF